MTRHGSPSKTITVTAIWSVRQCAPISNAILTPSKRPNETHTNRNLTVLDMAIIGPRTALPAWQRLPGRSIPKLFCP